MPQNLQIISSFICILFLSIITHSITCSSSIESNSPSSPIPSLIIDLWNDILRLSADKVKTYTIDNPECSSIISTMLLNKSMDNIFVSGHTFYQLGNERNCSDNYQYYLIELQFKDKLTPDNSEEEVAKFLNISSYNIGLCIWEVCNDIIEKILDYKENRILFDELNRQYDITKLKSAKLIESSYSTSAIFFFSIVVAYVSIIVIVKLLGTLFIREEIEELHMIKEEVPDPIDNPKEDNEEEEENDEGKDKGNVSDEKSDLFNEVNEKSVNLDNIKKYIKDIDDENKSVENHNMSLSNILEKINVAYLSNVNLNTLFNANNFLYPHTNSLNSLSGIRWLIIILFTFNNVFFMFYKTPLASTSNGNIFFLYSFSFVKLSSFAIHCWLFLDGFIYAHKLMSAIKLNQSFLSFLQFYLKNIPRIIVFYICFYFMVKNGKDFAVLYGMTYQFSQYYVNFFQKDCLMQPSLLLVPFKLVYNNFTNMGYEQCFLFCYLFINEFFCFTIALILFYFLYKYKSVKMDITINIAVIINVLMSYFSFLPLFQQEDAKLLSVKYVLGENLTIMFPHLMFNIFLIGILCGIIYYYYELSINDIDYYLNKEIYFPFAFLNRLMQLLSKQNKEKKIVMYILNILSLGIVLLICLEFPLYNKFSQWEDRTVLSNFTLAIRIIYVYERYVFIFLFGFLILQMLLSGQNVFTKLVINTKIFISFERLSFGYMCLCELFVSLFLTLFELQGLNWNYMTIIYISFALFVLIYACSLIITILFEFPFKFIIKVYGKLVYVTPYPRSHRSSFLHSHGLLPQ